MQAIGTDRDPNRSLQTVERPYLTVQALHEFERTCDWISTKNRQAAAGGAADIGMQSIRTDDDATRSSDSNSFEQDLNRIQNLSCRSGAHQSEMGQKPELIFSHAIKLTVNVWIVKPVQFM